MQYLIQDQNFTKDEKSKLKNKQRKRDSPKFNQWVSKDNFAGNLLQKNTKIEAAQPRPIEGAFRFQSQWSYCCCWCAHKTSNKQKRKKQGKQWNLTETRSPMTTSFPDTSMKLLPPPRPIVGVFPYPDDLDLLWDPFEGLSISFDELCSYSTTKTFKLLIGHSKCLTLFFSNLIS